MNKENQMVADPKPELSMRTLQINLELAHRRVRAAQQAYSGAYIGWLLLSGQIKERLADEHRRNNNA